jgi:hypothetical protein
MFLFRLAYHTQKFLMVAIACAIIRNLEYSYIININNENREMTGLRSDTSGHEYGVFFL